MHCFEHMLHSLVMHFMHFHGIGEYFRNECFVVIKQFIVRLIVIPNRLFEIVTQSGYFAVNEMSRFLKFAKKSRSVQKGQQFYGVCSNHWFNQCALSIFRHWFVNIVIVVVISLITRQSIKSSLCLTYPLRLLSIVAASISGAAAPPFKPNIFLITSIAL